MLNPNWSETTAVFGGTFDPPHLGHRIAAFQLFHEPGFARVKIIPAALPPLKTATTPSKHRLEMVKRTFEPKAGEPREIEIDTRELDRESNGKPSYTFDTIQELKTNGLKFAIVLGTDQLETLPKWHRFPEILGLCPWVILERKPNASARIEKMLKEFEASGLLRRIGDRRFALPGNQTLTQIPTPAPELNSTEIRRQIALNGAIPENQLAPRVEAYLKEHGLYGIHR